MMIFRFLKPAMVLAVSTVVVGYCLFGSSFLSYLRTSGRVVQRAARDRVSLDFELQRARDLVAQILPQLQAEVRMIAEEEVAISSLEDDIDSARKALESRKRQLVSLRDQLKADDEAPYTVGVRELSRDQLAEHLSHEFERYRESELILAGKEKLLETRRESLANALRMHERTRHDKLKLEQQIEALVAKHRLIRTGATGSAVAVEPGQLGEAEHLIAQIQRRLDIAGRVLAHESELQGVQWKSNEINEPELLAEFDQYFATDREAALVSRK